ncbi:hypothetical protein [Paenibacillus helianthi]|uniref:hypothetical protein n=1 Tax=Paenibacillus helianthi TaxID=1349432 RepID=UPI001ABF9A43|nr:hypothetical protein [Paenibacillus helianthi]
MISLRTITLENRRILFNLESSMKVSASMTTAKSATTSQSPYCGCDMQQAQQVFFAVLISPGLSGARSAIYPIHVASLFF